MQFKVPQFLDIEDKIFGPFTFSQFAYLAGGTGMAFVVYILIGLLLGFIPILMIAAFSGALAFYRPNGKPLVNMLEAGLKYATQDKLYIWKRRTEKIKKAAMEANAQKTESMNQNGVRLSGSKLRDLAWSLDVLDLKKEKE